MEERGRREGRETRGRKERQEGREDGEKEREGDRRKEGGEEGSRNQTASQGDPEFPGLCPEEEEVPCALSMGMYK